MNKAFVFRIYPNGEREVLINGTFGRCRFVWNRMLTDRKIWCLITNDSVRIAPARYKKRWPWPREIDSMAPRDVPLNQEKAFRDFFRNPGHFGSPKYKSKRGDRPSYTTNLIGGNIELRGDGKLKLPKLGLAKVIRRRDIPEDYRLKSVTASRNAAGQCHAALPREFDAPAPAAVETDADKALGLDFSTPDLYVDSEGKKPGEPRRRGNAEKRLARERRKLHKRGKGSENGNKQRNRLAKRHLKARNQRKDFLEKESGRIAHAFDAVIAEDIDTRGVAQASRRGESVADNGWGMFVNMSRRELEERGKRFVLVDRFYPSSETRSARGAARPALGLAERVRVRDRRGHARVADVNAALNIRAEGPRTLGLAIDKNRGTRGVSPDVNLAGPRRLEREAPGL
ncbi:MAG: transposase [Deltaproteobacteria bacterium]|jgi:putative transposase|nr:transposase [Deltaproteobacteria bacterium]